MYVISTNKCELVHVVNNEHNGELIEKARSVFDIHFTSQEEREVFQHRLKNVRQLLIPPDSRSLDNYSLFKDTV